MISTLAQLEHKIGDKVFRYVFDHDSQITDILDGLYKFIGVVQTIQKNIVESQNKEAPAPESSSETSEEKKE